ncbi:hypothetical protein MPTK1_3g16460 [Marchantia polymorpha subsp. ruderalis]
MWVGMTGIRWRMDETMDRGCSTGRMEKEHNSKHIPYLPPEIIWKILSKLQTVTIMRCREVCKQWKSTIETPSLALQFQSSKPVLLYHHPGHSSPKEGSCLGRKLAAAAGTRKWHLKFHNTVSNKWETHHLPFAIGNDNVEPDTLLAADGGLLCFSSKRSPNSIVVYNPLSQQWRQISLPASFLPTVFSEDHRGNPFECFLLGMVVDRNTGCYKVVVSGLALEIPQPTFTFDSRTGSWQASTGEQGVDNNGVFGGKMRIGEWRRKKRGVQCGGNLYWFIQYERRMHPKSGALLKYNVESQVWEVLMESGLSQCVLPEFHMAVHKGDVIMVNWNDSNCYRGVGHLEIENLGDEIKLMDYGLVSLYHNAEPEKFWKQFLPIKCLAEGGTFYIVHVHHLDCHIPRVLVYRPSEPSGKKFSWLPPWEDLRDDNLLWTFTPTLKAFV